MALLACFPNPHPLVRRVNTSPTLARRTIKSGDVDPPRLRWVEVSEWFQAGGMGFFDESELSQVWLGNPDVFHRGGSRPEVRSLGGPQQVATRRENTSGTSRNTATATHSGQPSRPSWIFRVMNNSADRADRQTNRLSLIYRCAIEKLIIGRIDSTKDCIMTNALL